MRAELQLTVSVSVLNPRFSWRGRADWPHNWGTERHHLCCREFQCRIPVFRSCRCTYRRETRRQTSSGAPQQEGNVGTNVLKMQSYCFRCKNRINAETQELLEAQLKSNFGKQTKTPNPSASPSLFLWHQGIFGFRFSFRTLWPLAERKSHGSVDIFILSQCGRKQFVQVGFSGDFS